MSSRRVGTPFHKKASPHKGESRVRFRRAVEGGMVNARLATAIAVVCLIAGAPFTGSFQVERPGLPLAHASPGLLAFSTSSGLGNWYGECRRGVSSMKKPAIFTSKAIGARFRTLQQPLGCVATATGGEQQEKQRTEGQQQQQQQVDDNGGMEDAPTPLQSIAQEPKAAEAAFGAQDQAPPDIELVGRQEFQDLCVPKLVRVGQSVPADWTQGVHLSSPAWDLRPGEIAVLMGTDGSRKFCRIDSIKGGKSGDSEALLEGGNSLGLDIQAEVGRKQGSQVMRVQGSRLAKVLPLQLSDLQRLAALKSEVVVERGDEREPGTDGPPATILESLRRLMDVDKTTKVEDLPFQPMLSQSSSRGSKQGPRDEVAVASGKGSDSPFSERWGELNGWWTDKVNNKELFEVELVRPLGLALTPVEGEGLVVSSVETGGHAECAGMRIGDVVTLSSLDLSDIDSTGKASSARDILMAVVSEESQTVRMRFERDIDQPVSTTFSSKKPWVAKSREKGGSKEGGGGDRKANERNLEFEVEKPVGITLIELAGYGVFVKEVMPGSNAAIVGIKVGDRITSTSSPLSYDAGTSFDRGTTYTTASGRSSSSSSSSSSSGGGRRSGSRDTLSSVLSAVSSGGDMIAIGVVRDKAGKALVDLANASPLDSEVEGPASRLKVDASLTEKVRGALLDEEERAVEAKGRPLKVNLDLLNFHARRARERKQPEKALSMLAKCIRLDPYDGRAWLATAKHFERQRNYNAAREWLNKGLQYSPSNPYLLQSLGVLEERTGDLVAARALYVKSTKIDPGHAPSWVSLGKLEERTKRQERARECYRAATKADPLNYYAWQAWAVLEARLGNTNEARRLFEVCSEVNPNNAAVWQAWGVLESRLRNYDVAVDCFQRGLQVSPRNTYVLQAWAVLEWKRDDLVAANELFEKAITYKPGDGGVYQAYAMLLRDRKLYSSARAMLQRGTEACREHLALWQAWGLMEADLGNVDKAREIFQQGIWASGGSEKMHMIWQAWGLLEARMGDVTTARKYLSRAVEGASRPSGCYIAWSKLEEDLGELSTARRLYEEAVVAEPFNIKLWAAYENFERRVSGEGSVVSELYERRLIAEMRSRGGIGNIGNIEPTPLTTGSSSGIKGEGNFEGKSAFKKRGKGRGRASESQEGDAGLYKAKWTTPRRRKS